MDIQNLRSFLTPEAWQALERYFTRGIKNQLQAVLLSTTSPPAPSALTLRQSQQPRPSASGRRPVYPLDIDPSTLAWTPKPIPKMKRTHPAIALRRDLIAEALKKDLAVGANEDEIAEHLIAANFPVDDSYYGAEVSGQLRISSSISNDLRLFLKKKWVRRIGKRWKWVRSKGP
jgi:hypothetical protein